MIPIDLPSIQVSLYHYDYYLCIVDGKVIRFKDDGSRDNKHWGNEYLADQFFPFLLESDPSIPDNIRVLMTEYMQTYLLLKQRLLNSDAQTTDPYERFLTVEKDTYKDLIGVFGPQISNNSAFIWEILSSSGMEILGCMCCHPIVMEFVDNIIEQTSEYKRLPLPWRAVILTFLNTVSEITPVDWYNNRYPYEKLGYCIKDIYASYWRKD